MSFLYPRRFSEMWQIAQDWPGTLDQQRAVRDALAVEFGSPQHRVLQKMDRDINLRSRHYLPIGFNDLPPGFLAHAGATGIVLSKLLHPNYLADIVRHETGHVYEQLDLLTQTDKFWYMEQVSPTDRDWRHFTEAFADSFRDWWKGVGWDSLTAILLPT